MIAQRRKHLWSDPAALAVLAGGLAMLALFLLIEVRTASRSEPEDNAGSRAPRPRTW